MRMHFFACKGTKNFWDVQIYLQHFNKNSSTAVPLRNERGERNLGTAKFLTKKICRSYPWG